MNAPILAFPQLDQQFILDTNASHRGLGVVLSQVKDGKEPVIAYVACALSKAERHYSTTWKDLLALVWGTEHFESYLYSKRFLARNDHSWIVLQWLKNFKNPMGQVARWLEKLTYFDFEVEHCCGQLHGNANGLSRLTWETTTFAEQDEDAVLIHSVNVEPLSRESIKAT